ncbi:MAG: hypothetical protein O2912_01585 [Proteobacteria bacterium]|nr:hypothetical protein [Pseudomonadota bacterium]
MSDTGKIIPVTPAQAGVQRSENAMTTDCNDGPSVSPWIPDNAHGVSGMTKPSDGGQTV